MWKLSTGLRNALLKLNARAINAVSGTDIFFGVGDGDGGRDTINSTATDLSNFVIGDMMSALLNAGSVITSKVLSVSATKVEVAAGTLTAEAAGPTVILVSCLGGSYAGIFRNCTLKSFTGVQPASANDAETGAALIQYTLEGGVFVPGAPDNGLNFGQVAIATLHKAIDPRTGNAEIWSGQAVSSGVAGWFRIYSNDMITGLSEEAVRLDGAIAVSGAQLNMTDTTLTSGVFSTIDNVDLPLPASPTA